MPAELSVELPRTAVAPSHARRALSRLEGEVPPERLAEMRLLVS